MCNLLDNSFMIEINSVLYSLAYFSQAIASDLCSLDDVYIV